MLNVSFNESNINKEEDYKDDRASCSNFFSPSDKKISIVSAISEGARPLSQSNISIPTSTMRNSQNDSKFK